MENFVKSLKNWGFKLLEGLVILALIIIVDVVLYKATGSSIVNIIQQIVNIFNILLDKIQGWYIK